MGAVLRELGHQGVPEDIWRCGLCCSRPGLLGHDCVHLTCTAQKCRSCCGLHKKFAAVHEAPPLLRICSHLGTMPSRGFPIVDPCLADSIGSFEQLLAGCMSVFDDHDESGIEILLCVIDIGRA